MYIYTFYKRNNINEKIRIAAYSCFEAVNALYSLNNYANYVYDLTTYRLDELWAVAKDEYKDEYCSIMGIGEDYMCFPIFISEEKYQKMSNKKWFRGNVNNQLISDDLNKTYSKSIVEKIDNMKQHPSNTGVNTFLPTDNNYM